MYNVIKLINSHYIPLNGTHILHGTKLNQSKLHYYVSYCVLAPEVEQMDHGDMQWEQQILAKQRSVALC